MADEIGLKVVTDAIKEKVPKPIPLNKLVIDDFQGDILNEKGELVDPLKNRLSEDYEQPKPVHAPNLGAALAAFHPQKLVKISSLTKPGETKTYRVTYESMGDFEPGSYEKRIPELRQLVAEEEGLKKLLDLLKTPEGRTQIQLLLKDKVFSAALGDLRAVFTEYLARIEAVLAEERVEQ